jgi:hypothetical protein
MAQGRKDGKASARRGGKAMAQGRRARIVARKGDGATTRRAGRVAARKGAGSMGRRHRVTTRNDVISIFLFTETLIGDAHQVMSPISFKCKT